MNKITIWAALNFWISGFVTVRCINAIETQQANWAALFAALAVFNLWAAIKEMR